MFRKKTIYFIYYFFYLGRPSVLLRDEQRTTNGGDAVIDMGSDGMYNSSMKQLQVIDETVGFVFLLFK